MFGRQFFVLLHINDVARSECQCGRSFLLDTKCCVVGDRITFLRGKESSKRNKESVSIMSCKIGSSLFCQYRAKQCHK